MEHVLYRLHIRLLQGSNRFLGNKVRRTLEFSVLAFAVTCLGLLFTMHSSFVLDTKGQVQNCLAKSLNFATQAGNAYDVVEIRISDYNLTGKLNTGVSYADRDKMYLFSYERGLLMLNNDLRDKNNFTRYTVDIDAQGDCFGSKSLAFVLRTWAGYDIVIMNWAVAAFGGNGYLYKASTKELFNLNYAGDFESKKGISLQDNGKNIHLDLTNSVLTKVYTFLFGKPIDSLGNSVTSSSVASPSSSYHCFGIIACPEGEECPNSDMSTSNCLGLITLKLNQYAGFRIGVVLSVLFLFIVTTTLVSYTLRETQERMLKFTYLLQYHVAHRLPIVSLVSTHVLESLIFVPIMMGIYFFLFEFFSDQLLAFLVILVVWMGEIFSVLSCRCRTSIKYFPKIFGCYFALFHIYFFAFPFGFSYLALLTCIAFILHSMMHLWNVFEVPAVEVGVVHAQQLRFGFVVPSDIVMANLVPPAAVTEANRLERRQRLEEPEGEEEDGTTSSPSRPPKAITSLSESPKRQPASNSKTFTGSFPSIYETPGARAIRLQAKDDHTPLCTENSSKQSTFNNKSSNNSNSTSTNSSVKIFTPPSAAAPAAIIGTTASVSESSVTRLKNLRLRSNSEGSSGVGTSGKSERSRAGSEDGKGMTPTNKYGYSSEKFNVFGALEDN